MAYENLELERHGHVAVVTMNRPDRLNALNRALQQDILDVCAETGDDDGVRAVIITGAGRGFCSGADLSGGRPPEGGATSHRVALDEMGWVGRQATALYGLGKPTIAAVNGIAAGAGMSLALACDMRVGGPAARFKTVFLERSLSPDSGMSFFLPRIVGYSRAADLVYTSRSVDADEAYRIGLLDRLVEDDPLGAAVAVAEQIAAMPPLAVQSAKRVLQHNMEADLTEALRYETAGLGYARRARNDVAESMAAFREKRPGRFTGT